MVFGKQSYSSVDGRERNHRIHITATVLPRLATTPDSAVSIRPTAGTYVIAIAGYEFLSSLWHLCMLIVSIVQPLPIIGP